MRSMVEGAVARSVEPDALRLGSAFDADSKGGSPLHRLRRFPSPALRAGEDLLRRLPRVLVELVGYGAVSIVALACDYGLLLAFVAAGLNYLVAATISFSVGMVVAYALSVRFVFTHRRGVSREAEAAGFFAVGLAGLLLTQLLLWLFVSRLGLHVAVAKIPTTGVCFLFNFVCRRSLVFVGTRGR